MPPSTQPEDDFITIKSHNDDGDIDACTISITGISANVFTNLLVSAA